MRNKIGTFLLALVMIFGLSMNSVTARADVNTSYPEIKDYQSPLMIVKMSFDGTDDGDLVLLYGGYFTISEFIRSPEYKNDLDPMWMYYSNQVKLGNIKI